MNPGRSTLMTSVGIRASPAGPQPRDGLRRTLRAMVHSPPVIPRILGLVALCALVSLGAARPAFCDDGLHVVLTPSHNPPALTAPRHEFRKVIATHTGMPVPAPVASDCAAATEARGN